MNTEENQLPRFGLDPGNINLYLRPMSSMTKEERAELRVLKNRLIERNEDNDEKYYGITIDCISLI